MCDAPVPLENISSESFGEKDISRGPWWYSVSGGLSLRLTFCRDGGIYQDSRHLIKTVKQARYSQIYPLTGSAMVDRWGWGSQPIPVLNFGYFPQEINDEINNITEEFLLMVMRHAEWSTLIGRDPRDTYWCLASMQGKVLL